MVKYSYAERVVKKIRKLLRYDQSLVDCLKAGPLVEVDGSTFELFSVVWNYYNISVVADQNNIFVSDRGQRRNLVQYNGFDGLLAL